MKPYHPIDCALYDQYILYIERKQQFELDGIPVFLKDMYTRNKLEYVLLSSGEELRLDNFKIEQNVILRQKKN